MCRDSGFGIRDSGEPCVVTFLNSASTSNTPTNITSVAGGALQPRKCHGSKADAAVVASVSVEVAALASGVMLAGENKHVVRASRPEQAKFMAPGKEPNCGATVTL